MLFKVFAVAGWAVLAAVSGASAQSLGGPAEMPPSSFKGSQYVDSRGCVYLRAGIGGRVNWVPRISRDRKALCGPSRAASARAAAQAEAAPAAAPVMQRAAPPAAERVGRPMETIASVRRTAPPPRMAPARQVQTSVKPPAVQPNATPRTRGCPASSPYGARVKLSDGRRSLICSSEANFNVQSALASLRLRGAVPAPAPNGVSRNVPPVLTSGAFGSSDGYTPRRPAVSRSYAPQTGGSVHRSASIAPQGRYDGYTPRRSVGSSASQTYATGQASATGGGYAAPEPAITVPKGYKKAWEDDRLNPNRGKGTARGQAQQDAIWSRDIPAQRITGTKAATRQTHTTSTSNAPRTPKVTTGRFYVQVGTFGEAANAARTASRLQAMGLPVAKSRITSKGRQLQIVLAGPFRDSGSASAALSQARRSGFGDAFIR